MRPRRVAPATVVVGKREIRGAEVGGGDENRWAAGMAPLGVVGALDLEARAAAEAVIEECRAQRRRVHAVALAVEVAVPACPS